MENMDLDLIHRLMTQDDELRGLMHEHEELERQIEVLNHRPFLTPADELERKRLQKLKLRGRDRIEEILKSHRP